MTLLSVSLLVTLLQFFTLFASVESAGRDDWRRRSVYQLMTDRFARDNDTDLSACDPVKYCGGTYKGLINHLDWIQDMGFTAVSHSLIDLTNYRFGSVLLPRVWKLLRSMVTISTVYLRFWGGLIEGYWTTDLLDVNTHFGTAEEIKELSDELHRRDMVCPAPDIINDSIWCSILPSMEWLLWGATPLISRQSITRTSFRSTSLTIFTHIVQSTSPTIPATMWYVLSKYMSLTNQCWFGDKYVALADINTDNTFVSNWILNWIPQLISNYSGSCPLFIPNL